MAFSYQVPDNRVFYATLYKYVVAVKDQEVADILKGGKCIINTTKNYSRVRWDAYDADIIISISLDALAKVDKVVTGRLYQYCHDVLPPDAGYDLKEVRCAPDFQAEANENLLSDLHAHLSVDKYEFQLFTLDQDVKDKGAEMSEVYTYLYYAENMLRKFILTIARLHYGGKDYLSKLQFSRGVRDKIAQRKREEARNQWVSVRGDSEIYYLDFVELSDVIINNWEIFKSYFPDQSWIKTKIDDMYKCRCLVAHNSYVSKHDRDVIRVNFTSIIKQINGAMKGDPDDLPF